MAEKSLYVVSKKSPGDTAVDGLIAGMAAGLVMALYLLGAGLVVGQNLEQVLAQFDPAAQSWLAGALAHLAISGIYGVIFALLLALLPLRFRSWLAGLVFGVVLLVLALGALSTAVDVPLRQTPTLHIVVAHLVYGAVLGGWLTKK